VAPLLVASSSRPPAVPSGGQERRGLSHVKSRRFRLTARTIRVGVPDVDLAGIGPNRFLRCGSYRPSKLGTQACQALACLVCSDLATASLAAATPVAVIM